MTDYNWLLSTIAQSSAALVGISSGFLILRISLFINEVINLKNIIKNLEIEHERTSPIPPKVWYKKYYDELNEKRFPKSIYWGLIGIIWLIIFGLIYPVWMTPQSSLNTRHEFFLKFSFIIGLILLLAYLLMEIWKLKKMTWNVNSEDSLKKN